MQNSNLGDLYIKTSDESLEHFANYTPLMYLASKHFCIFVFGKLVFLDREKVVLIVDFLCLTF